MALAWVQGRGADAVPPELTCSLPALWKGVLYDAEARRTVWALLEGFAMAEREAARVDVARRGLGARYGGEAVLELAREVVGIARQGLARIAHPGKRDADETAFLDPVFEQIELGRSPGESVVERWESEWDRTPQRLIDYARY